MTGSVVALEHVQRSFGANPALRDLSLQVPRQTITVLLGPNGAGKTTAIRMIPGALSPDAGTVRVFGLDPDADGEAVRTRCGVVSAKPALYDRLSGRPTGIPRSDASPEVAWVRPSRILTAVVLPAPFGPSSPKISPGSTRSDTPSSAVTIVRPKREEYLLVTSETEIAAWVINASIRRKTPGCSERFRDASS